MPLLEFLLSQPYLMVFIVILAIIFVKKHIDYKNCTYYRITKKPYLSMRNDKGLYGEYLTYKNLRYLESDGAKFLFNVYIPKGNGETTEIDVLMISPKGIFVFESKNYSGWIFGGEDQKNWYQTLPTGRGRCHKEKFYNPIMQNDTHIKYLKEYLREDIPTWSIVVFSDRCKLKRLQIHSRDIIVVNRNRVVPIMASIYANVPGDILDEDNIVRIYNQLYACTQVSESVKEQHVENLHHKQKGVDPFSDIFSQKAKYTTYSIKESGEIDKIHSSNRQSIERDKRCPICGGKLVVRTATKGENKGNQFYGCSNYPKCLYIRDIIND